MLLSTLPASYPYTADNGNHVFVIIIKVLDVPPQLSIFAVVDASFRPRYRKRMETKR